MANNLLMKGLERVHDRLPWDTGGLWPPELMECAEIGGEWATPTSDSPSSIPMSVECELNPKVTFGSAVRTVSCVPTKNVWAYCSTICEHIKGAASSIYVGREY